MDNSITLANYKYYLENGIRSNYYVTFLNIEKSLDSEIVGVLFQVNQKMLDKLISRERNYDLVEITNSLDIEVTNEAYTFIGKKESVNRFEKGLLENRSVISREYYDFVQNSYRKLEENRSNWKEYFNREYDENFLDSYLAFSFRDNRVLLICQPQLGQRI